MFFDKNKEKHCQGREDEPLPDELFERCFNPYSHWALITKCVLTEILSYVQYTMKEIAFYSNKYIFKVFYLVFLPVSA